MGESAELNFRRNRKFSLGGKVIPRPAGDACYLSTREQGVFLFVFLSVMKDTVKTANISGER